MEEIRVDNDIKVFYVTATSFPDGVMDAHKKLHALVPPSSGRIYYGISRPEGGGIKYKVGVEEMYPGEAEKFQCDTLVLKKGKYVSVTIKDYMNDIPAIGKTFRQLLAHPNIDPDGYCVEVYVNDWDVQCMVRLKND